MWTSQVYGHHDKMARTKTHRTSQNTEYSSKSTGSGNMFMWCFILDNEESLVQVALIMGKCIVAVSPMWSKEASTGAPLNAEYWTFCSKKNSQTHSVDRKAFKE